MSNPIFAPAVTNPFGLINIGVSATPTFVDINGDGNLDAFFGDQFGVTVFFKNTGTTTNPAFATAQINPFGLSNFGQYSNPTLVDINGDGNLDAFVGINTGDTVFFKNTGTTTNPAFATAQTNPFGLSNFGSFSYPTFVDINGDGNLDAFFCDALGNTLFFRNVKPPEISRAKYDVNTSSLVVTGTGLLALTGANNDIDVSKLTITGEGGTSYTLTSANVEITSGTSFTVNLNPTDKAALNSIVNKLGTQSNSGTIYNLAAAEDWAAGAAPAVVVADLTGNGITATRDPIFATAATNPFGFANVGLIGTPTLVDINGDGKLDALVGNNTGNILFFKNTGTTAIPAFAAAEINPFGLTTIGANPTFVDIDGDGKFDALCGFGGDIRFLKNTGTTTTPAFATGAAVLTNPFGLTNVGTGANPTFVDIDGDGDLDAFVGNSVGNTLFFKNTSTTTTPAFATAITNPFGLIDIGAYSSPTFVDIDGDGKLDAFVGNFDGNTLFFNNTLPPAPTTTTTRTDFDGDKKSDILWRNNDGTVALWKMNGATVTSGSYVTPTLDSSWKIAGVADFSGDGKADILWRNDNNTTVIWKMDGANVTNGSYLTPTLDSTWKVASTGDFDGDKKADILWRKDDGTVALWKMNGATVTIGSYLTPTLGNSWKVASTADFDGDGKSDILWRNDDGTTALWKMDGASLVAGNYLSVGLDSTWKVAGTADFNGDGKADILWRNDNGTTAQWTMNGATVLAGSYVTPTLDSSWQVAAPIL